MWKENYEQLMFSKKEEDINTLEGFKLKCSNIPSKLYKYRELSDYLIDNLKNNTVWLSKATEFNDPYDSGLTVCDEIGFEGKHKENYIRILADRFEVPFKEIENIMKSLDLKQTIEFMLYYYSDLEKQPQLVPEAANRIMSGIDKEFNNYNQGVSQLYQNSAFATCFSQNPDSMLMWSHYAKNHTGIALEYDFNGLDFNKHNDVLWGLHPVYYREKLLNLEDYKDVRDKIAMPIWAAINKSIEWSYEKEWRIIILKNREDALNLKGFNEPIIPPKSIIFGAKTTDEWKQKVINAVEHTNIKFKEIKLDTMQYGLTIVDL